MSITALTLATLINTCSPNVSPDTMTSIVNVESAMNPFAIAIVKDEPLKSQPQSKGDAIKIINRLEKNNSNYSVGLAQINKSNFARLGTNGIALLDPCTNLKVAEKVLSECYETYGSINKTLSCYYSGNDKRGFKVDYDNTSYVERAHIQNNRSYSVPSLSTEKITLSEMAMKSRSLKIARAKVVNVSSDNVSYPLLKIQEKPASPAGVFIYKGEIIKNYSLISK